MSKWGNMTLSDRVLRTSILLHFVVDGVRQECIGCPYATKLKCEQYNSTGSVLYCAKIKEEEQKKMDEIYREEHHA